MLEPLNIRWIPLPLEGDHKGTRVLFQKGTRLLKIGGQVAASEAQVNFLADLMYGITGQRMSDAKRAKVHAMNSHTVSNLIDQAREQHGPGRMERLAWPALAPLPPDPRVASIDLTLHIPSPAEVEAAKTEAGAFTKKTLARWGVPWPPPRGWLAILMQEYKKQQAERRKPMALEDMR